MSYKSIIVEKKNAVAWVTLNRPDTLNGLDVSALIELQHEVKGIEDDKTVRVLVLRGSGRGFSLLCDSSFSNTCRICMSDFTIPM